MMQDFFAPPKTRAQHGAKEAITKVAFRLEAALDRDQHTEDLHERERAGSLLHQHFGGRPYGCGDGKLLGNMLGRA